jgi:hypothetical protein
MTKRHDIERSPGFDGFLALGGPVYPSGLANASDRAEKIPKP